MVTGGSVASRAVVEVGRLGGQGTHEVDGDLHHVGDPFGGQPILERRVDDGTAEPMAGVEEFCHRILGRPALGQ